MSRPRKSSLVSIKSREQLIVDSNDIESIKRLRRTKIMCSISDKTNKYEIVKDFILNGADCLNFNVSYSMSKQRDAIKHIANIRDRLEEELGRHIPLNMMLKGRQIRVGQLKSPEVYLHENHDIRLISDKRVIGDQNIISIDDEDFFDQIRIGDRIAMDYGQVVLIVKGKEDSETAYRYLMEEFPDMYSTVQSFRRQLVMKRSQDSLSDFSSKIETLSHNENEHYLETPSMLSSIDEIQSDTPMRARKKKFSEIIQKKKLSKVYQVLICAVKCNCVIRPLRPVFLLNQIDWLDSPIMRQSKIIQEEYQSNSDHEELEDESQITAQDISYIKLAKQNQFDSITVSNICSAREVGEIRQLLGKDSIVKVLIRITTPKGVQHFEEIARAADGCIIARAYLSVQTMIEGVIEQQIKMIKTAQKLFKPIIIASQILESMISSLIPTFSEMGDISNLVNEDVDAIMLTGETTYGQYPVQTIATLDRVCRKVENIQRAKRAINFQEKDQGIQIHKNIVNTIAQATVDAAYRINAQLIIVLTSSGSTAIKISKLKPPCAILAITSSMNLARQLRIIGGVQPFVFGTLYGTEALIQKVVDSCLKKQIILKGEFIICLSGKVENLAGNINTIKIIQA